MGIASFIFKYRKILSLVGAAVAIIMATALFMRSVYIAGKNAGVAEVTSSYLERDVAALQAVSERLAEVAVENKRTLRAWEDEAQVIADAVTEKIENKETVLREIPVEKIVTVEPDCRISYSAIGLLDEIGSASAPADN